MNLGFTSCSERYSFLSDWKCFKIYCVIVGAFPGGSVIRKPPANAGDMNLILGWEDSRRRKWQPTSVSYLGNPTNRGAWQGYGSMGHKESDMTWWLNNSNNYYPLSFFAFSFWIQVKIVLVYVWQNNIFFLNVWLTVCMPFIGVLNFSICCKLKVCVPRNNSCVAVLTPKIMVNG